MPGEYLPTVHAVQEEPKAPGLHVQAVAPTGEVMFPVQAEHDLAPPVLNFPAAQGVHSAAAVDALYVPPGQGVHELALTLLKKPTAHAVQGDWPPVE